MRDPREDRELYEARESKRVQRTRKRSADLGVTIGDAPHPTMTEPPIGPEMSS